MFSLIISAMPVRECEYPNRLNMALDNGFTASVNELLRNEA